MVKPPTQNYRPLPAVSQRLQQFWDTACRVMDFAPHTSVERLPHVLRAVGEINQTPATLTVGLNNELCDPVRVMPQMFHPPILVMDNAVLTPTVEPASRVRAREILNLLADMQRGERVDRPLQFSLWASQTIHDPDLYEKACLAAQEHGVSGCQTILDFSVPYYQGRDLVMVPQPLVEAPMEVAAAWWAVQQTDPGLVLSSYETAGVPHYRPDVAMVWLQIFVQNKKRISN
ncbi:hypothetical protein [Mobiluncus curtisii]|uniref:hypothetical protein n=1 Tax=Mobiluncus curtisii TaxID=2051 RepID=UPI00147000CB|nr:hypothetical protein [Mobiluncus curtisii]NMW48934.1 hypothetical protein [Mobiluncus curtisii]NMW89049.1 hypothetical protein [Mobiluncus curtisii]